MFIWEVKKVLSNIGVVGPEESVNKILNVAQQLSNTRCIPFTYKNVEELLSLIKRGNHVVDQWLFYGVMNYSYAIQHRLVEAEQSSYPLLHGSSFFGKLLEIQQNEQRLFSSFSIDTITDK